MLRDPRLGARARARPRRRPGALPPHGPGHRGHGRLPDPPVALGIAGCSSRSDRRARSRRPLAVGGASPPSSSVSPRSRRSATCSPAWCCSARGRSASATASASRRARWRARSRAVASLGLLYTDAGARRGLDHGPEHVVLSSAIVPLREPDAVDLRARLRPGRQADRRPGLLDERVSVPDARGAAHRPRGDRRRRGRRPHDRRRRRAIRRARSWPTRSSSPSRRWPATATTPNESAAEALDNGPTARDERDGGVSPTRRRAGRTSRGEGARGEARPPTTASPGARRPAGPGSCRTPCGG